MNLARLIVAPGSGEAERVFYRDFSMWFGLVMVLLAFWIDARSRARGASRRDYAFWLYLLGMLTFWGALSARAVLRTPGPAPYQIASRARTPSAGMSLPRPCITTSPRSITRYWSASSSAKS